MIPIFTGKVINKNFKPDNIKRLEDYLLTLEGQECDATIRKHKSQRSNNQNNYYFGVVCKILGDYFGYTQEEMHDALKYKFLRKGAADLETVTSTTKLNTAEFEDYLEKIRRWAVIDYNVVIPLPNEIIMN
jgi:hypothetical protein